MTIMFHRTEHKVIDWMTAHLVYVRSFTLSQILYRMLRLKSG